MRRLTLEQRHHPSLAIRTLSPIAATVITVLVGSAMFSVLGFEPLETLRVFFVEPLSSVYGISELLVKACPLILIGLGLAIGFRANIWNIGAEGQLTIGAICAGGIALAIGEQDFGFTLLVMAILGGLGGMAWAAIPAFLKVRFNTNEILVTLMLNYVAILLLSYLVRSPWRDPFGFNFPQTALFHPSAMFSPLYPGLRVTGSIFIVIACVIIAWAIVTRSFLGFRIAIAGKAPKAGLFAGYRENQAIWLGLLIGGGAAGLAGMAEAAGPLGQLLPTISPGYGYTAIIVAFIGRLHPVGVVFGGLLVSLIASGGESAQMLLGMHSSLAKLFQGMLLFFVLAADVLVFYKLKLVTR
jgi:simple sugar transport system permease protein